MSNPKKPRVVTPEQARQYRHLAGEKITVLLAGSDTGGNFALLLDECPPGGGPPLHIHHNEDETFYILEGELEMRVGEKTFTASAGTSVFLPKGSAHTFRNSSDQPARSIALLTPAGLEGFFREVEDLLSKGEPDMASVLSVAGKYGLEAIGPPLAESSR